MRLLSVAVRRAAGVVAVALASAALGTIANAAPFQNGSFESGTITQSFSTLGTGSTAITGWTVTAGSVDYIGNYWPAGDGSRSLDMAGDSNGAVAQTFDTVPGMNYSVRFLMAANTGCGPTVKTLTASAGGTSQAFTFDGTGHSVGNMGWEPRSFVFQAPSSATTLTFANGGADSACGAALDGVSVTLLPPVPVVGSAAGAGIGLLLLAWFALGRRSRARR